MKKVLFIAAIVGAVGLGAMIGPVTGFADDNFTPPFAQMKQQYLNGDNATWNPVGPRMGRNFAGTMHDTVAEILGITEDELDSLRASGKSLEEIAEEKGITTEQLVEVLVKARTEQLDQLVEDGKITEEQKTAILENMEENIKNAITNSDFGPGKGFRGHGKGFRFNDPNFQPDQDKGYGPFWQQNNDTQSE